VGSRLLADEDLGHLVAVRREFKPHAVGIVDVERRAVAVILDNHILGGISSGPQPLVDFLLVLQVAVESDVGEWGRWGGGNRDLLIGILELKEGKGAAVGELEEGVAVHPVAWTMTTLRMSCPTGGLTPFSAATSTSGHPATSSSRTCRARAAGARRHLRAHHRPMHDRRLPLSLVPVASRGVV